MATKKPDFTNVFSPSGILFDSGSPASGAFDSSSITLPVGYEEGQFISVGPGGDEPENPTDQPQVQYPFGPPLPQKKHPLDPIATEKTEQPPPVYMGKPLKKKGFGEVDFSTERMTPSVGQLIRKMDSTIHALGLHTGPGPYPENVWKHPKVKEIHDKIEDLQSLKPPSFGMDPIQDWLVGFLVAPKFIMAGARFGADAAMAGARFVGGAIPETAVSGARKALVQSLAKKGAFAGSWASYGLLDVASYGAKLGWRMGKESIELSRNVFIPDLQTAFKLFKKRAHIYWDNLLGSDSKRIIDMAQKKASKVHERVGPIRQRFRSAKMDPKLGETTANENLFLTSELLKHTGKNFKALLKSRNFKKQLIPLGGLMGAAYEAHHQYYEEEFVPEKIALWSLFGSLGIPIANMSLRAAQNGVAYAKRYGMIPPWMRPFMKHKGADPDIGTHLQQYKHDMTESWFKADEWVKGNMALSDAQDFRVKQVLRSGVTNKTAKELGIPTPFEGLEPTALHKFPRKSRYLSAKPRMEGEENIIGRLSAELTPGHLQSLSLRKWQQHIMKKTGKGPSVAQIEEMKVALSSDSPLAAQRKIRKPATIPNISEERNLALRLSMDAIDKQIAGAVALNSEVERSLVQYGMLSLSRVKSLRKRYGHYISTVYENLETSGMLDMLAPPRPPHKSAQVRFHDVQSQARRAASAMEPFDPGFMGRKIESWQRTRGEMFAVKIPTPKQALKDSELPPGVKRKYEFNIYDRGEVRTVKVKALTEEQMASGKMVNYALKDILGIQSPTGLAPMELQAISRNPDLVLPKRKELLKTVPKGYTRLPKTDEWGILAGRTVKTDQKDKILTLVNTAKEEKAGSLRDKFVVLDRGDMVKGRDPNGNLILEKSGGRAFTIWRDTPPDVKTALGKVEGATVPVTKTFLSAKKKIALVDLLKKIEKNPNWVVSANPHEMPGLEWISIEKALTGRIRPGDSMHPEKAKLVPKSLSDAGYKLADLYTGLLDGKMIRKDVWLALEHAFKITDETPGLWSNLLSRWKYGKILLSPAAMMRNVQSNIIMMDMAGVSPFSLSGWKIYARAAMELSGSRELPKQFTFGYKKAFDSLKKKGLASGVDVGRFLKESMSKEAGHYLGTSMSKAEMTQLKGVAEGFLRSKTPLGGYSGSVTRFFDGITNLANKVGNKIHFSPSENYHAFEAFGKMAVFIHARTNMNLTIKQASDYARKYMIDYENVAPVLSSLRKGPAGIVGAPFITWSAHVLPLVAETLVKDPLKLMKWGLAGAGLGIASERYLRVKPSEGQAERELAGYNTQSYVKMPWADNEGNPTYFNTKYITPWGGAIDIFDFIKGKGSLWHLGTVPGFSSPAASIITDLMNISTVKPGKAKDPSASIGLHPSKWTREDWIARAMNMARTLLPPTTPGVGYTWQSVMDYFMSKKDIYTKLPPDFVPTFLGALAGIKLTNPDARANYLMKLAPLQEKGDMLSKQELMLSNRYRADQITQVQYDKDKDRIDRQKAELERKIAVFYNLYQETRAQTSNFGKWIHGW